MKKIGLLCGILQNKNIGNCSNGGISSKYDSVVLIDADVDAPFEPSEDSPAVKITRRLIGGLEYIYAEPVERCPAGHVGYMAGGCYIITSDRRFPFDYPIPLHDRTETIEQYDQLSQ